MRSGRFWKGFFIIRQAKTWIFGSFGQVLGKFLYFGISLEELFGGIGAWKESDSAEKHNLIHTKHSSLFSFMSFVFSPCDSSDSSDSSNASGSSASLLFSTFCGTYASATRLLRSWSVGGLADLGFYLFHLINRPT